MFFTRKRLKLYLAGLFIVQLATCLGFRSSVQSGAIDLRVYYTAGYMLRTGQTSRLYDLPSEKLLQNQLVAPMPAALAFFAPPFAALPFAPLSRFSYRHAFWLLFAINLALLLLAARILQPLLSALTLRWPPLPFLLFLTFIPAGLTLAMGQLSILMLLFFSMSYSLLQHSRPVLAGLLLSLALIKFQIALPAALLFLLWRQWRFLLGFLGGSSLLAALSVLLAGARECRLYLRSLLSSAGPLAAASAGTNNVSVHRMPNLYGLLATLTGRNHLALLLTLAASAALIAWAASRRPSLPLALLVSVSTGFYLFPCDLTLLLLPITLLCNRLFTEDEPPPTSPASPHPHLNWLQKHRRDLLFCALGTFLIAPALIEVIANNLIFLLALPILALALCPCDWSTLALPPNRSPHRAAPEHTTA